MTSQPSNKLSVKEKIGYGLGDTASNFVFHIVNAFLLVYYTDVLGLNPTAVGHCMPSLEFGMQCLTL